MSCELTAEGSTRTKRMNILQMVSSSRTSGAEKHVSVLAGQLRERGHNVIAACPPGNWLPAQLDGVGVQAYQMTMHGHRALPTVFGLPRFIKEHKIDIIHSHLTCATYLGCLMGHITSIPVVSSVHCRTHDVVYKHLLPTRRNRIITVSDWLRDALVAQGIPGDRVKTIYNGTTFCGADDQVDDSVLPVRAELSLPPEAELVGIFARVQEFKGHYVLVQAVKRILARRPNVYFVCVGPVEPQTQRELWELAAADGVAERIRFTGNRDDIRRLMSAMDVVTLPSRYEACSMAIIEAMALGKPVVATRAGGNPELITHCETGLLIERTPEALADALVRVLADTQWRRQLGNAAFERANVRFSAPIMAETVEALYLDLVGSAAA